MELKEFAKIIDGKTYDYTMFSKEELTTARENGFVIVTGASDDLMEFSGAIDDECGCFYGGIVYFSKDRVEEEKTLNAIRAIWCGKDAAETVVPWTYETDIPHETFNVYEDGQLYCKGIVFNINDVK